MTLLAAYAFDEGTGTTAAEVAGGPAITDVPGWATGRHGAAAQISADPGFTVDPYDGAGDFTIAFDVYIDAGGAWGYNMLLHETGGGILGTLQENGTGLEWYPFIGTTAGAATHNTWHHFAVVKQGTARHLYKNGVLLGSGAGAAGGAVNPVIIGSQEGGSYPGNFRVDNLRFYDAALTGDEIEALAGTPVEPEDVEPDPVTGALAGHLALGVSGALAGAVLTAGGLTGTLPLSLDADLAGAPAATGQLNGSVPLELASDLSGRPSVTGHLDGALPLTIAGQLTGDAESAAPGTLTGSLPLDLAGALAATTTVTGSLAADLPLALAGTLAGDAARPPVTGTLAGHLPLVLHGHLTDFAPVVRHLTAHRRPDPHALRHPDPTALRRADPTTRRRP